MIFFFNPGKSLNLLEVGQIGIMSFGETTKVLSSFGEPFNDDVGIRLFSQFSFNQKKTRINEMLDRAQEMMSQARQTNSPPGKQVSQLLMIISDGFGLSMEGEQALRLRIKRLYDQGLFIVFLILDNPANKSSILDSLTVENDGNGNLKLVPYKFPFPFYIQLRNIAQMPLVLGEALRQWFELVSVNDN